VGVVATGRGHIILRFCVRACQRPLPFLNVHIERAMRRRSLLILIAVTALTAAPGAQQPTTRPVTPIPPAPGAPATPRPTDQPGAQPPSAQPPIAQPPGITFRTEIEYVEVDAVVTDDRNNIVKGLTRDDFEVIEDGKPQKIELFSPVEIPVERTERFAGSPTPIRPDVLSNARPFDGRLYVIVLDDYHVSFLRSVGVKRAAKLFIDKYMGANDVAAVIHVSGRTDAAQEFTSDPALLHASIDKFMGDKLRSVTQEKLDDYNRQRNMQPVQSGSGDGSQSQEAIKAKDGLDFERGYKARGTLGTLRSLADFMSSIRGRRKAVLFFSEGIDYPIYDVFEARDASTIVMETRDAINAAARANVNFFTIDPRGLHNMGDEIMELDAGPEDQNLRLNAQGLSDERRLATDSLRTLAEETGGIAVVERNDFGTAYDRIVRENSSYYVLGYYPPSNKRDGRFHRISVKVKRPGLKVVARKGYSAPKGPLKKEPEIDPSNGTSPALRTLLNSPLQSSGLTLQVQAATFTGTKDNVAVTVEVQGRYLKFAQKDNLFANSIEVSILPLEARGKSKVQGTQIQGTRSEVKLNLKPQTAQIMAATAVRMTPRLSLPPGRYQLRVGARETGGGLTGTVFYDLEVPDYTKTKFAMSGLVVTAATAGVTPTAQADPTLKALLPGPPTTRREFFDIDKLALYAEVYDTIGGSTPHTVDITTRVTNESGKEVVKTTEARGSKELQGGSTPGAAGAGFGYATEFPLKDLPPGRYLLTVEAKPRIKDVDAVTRQMLFTVVATPQNRPTGGEE
jgi:VWFA-related protein